MSILDKFFLDVLNFAVQENSVPNNSVNNLRSNIIFFPCSIWYSCTMMVPAIWPPHSPLAIAVLRDMTLEPYPGNYVLIIIGIGSRG